MLVKSISTRIGIGFLREDHKGHKGDLELPVRCARSLVRTIQDLRISVALHRAVSAVSSLFRVYSRAFVVRFCVPCALLRLFLLGLRFAPLV